MSGTNGDAQVGTIRVKQGLAQMLKGGVIVSFFFIVD
jgi:pyridoxal biosynthesis lyase PdxS